MIKSDCWLLVVAQQELNNMPGKNKKPTCDLCCDSLDKGQEILKCEGDCGCTVHRYCAGVTRRHFEQLDKGSIPFANGARSKRHTIIQQLQSEVATLKLELAEAKTLAARPSATPPQTHSYASAASRPLDPVGNAANSKSRARGTRKRASRVVLSSARVLESPPLQRKPTQLILEMQQRTLIAVLSHEFKLKELAECGTLTSMLPPRRLKMQYPDSVWLKA